MQDAVAERAACVHARRALGCSRYSICEPRLPRSHVVIALRGAGASRAYHSDLYGNPAASASRPRTRWEARERSADVEPLLLAALHARASHPWPMQSRILVL